MQLPIEVISGAVSSLGIGGIFLYLYISERNTNKEMSEKLMTSYTENSRILEKHTQTLEAVESTMKTMSEHIYQALIERKLKRE